MYSLILMTAMAGAPDTPEFNGLFRCMFNGCCGGCCGGSGSSYDRTSGCYGSSCCGGGFGSRIRAFFDRMSCYGSCSGTSYACYGSSYSCNGGGSPLPPPGYDTFPAPAAPGLPYAPPAPAVPSGYLPIGTAPCCGDSYTLGTPSPVADPFAVGPYPSVPLAAGPIPSPMPPAAVPEENTARRVAFAPPGTAAGERARGTVVVKLPADARLYADGRPLNQTAAERTFVTPPLPVGQDYTYTFRAEYVRDGETISQTRRATVRPGHSATVEFTDLAMTRTGTKPTADVTARPDPVPLTAATKTAAEPVSKSNPFAAGPLPPAPAASERARITVKLPPGATLYVDGRKNDRTEPVREFSTPPLPQGQEFAYLMKAEVVRDGRPEYQLTKVTFRAGEIVTVDFTAPPAK
jgi:uncharacterized protein (TIGR03000 family)